MARQSTLKKHKAVINYFDNLFEKKRKRFDDSIKETASHFFYSERTIENILRERDKIMSH